MEREKVETSIFYVNPKINNLNKLKTNQCFIS